MGDRRSLRTFVEKSAGTSGEENAATDYHGKNTEKKGEEMVRCLFTYFLFLSVFLPCFSVAAFCILARQNREAHPRLIPSWP